MSKKRQDYMIQVAGGYVLPYRTLALLRRLRVSLEDARVEIGDADLNRILLSFMEPEA